jgi:hypothetical protein
MATHVLILVKGNVWIPASTLSEGEVMKPYLNGAQRDTTLKTEKEKLKEAYKIVTPVPIHAVDDMVILYALPDNDLNFLHGIITAPADDNGFYEVFVKLKNGDGVTMHLTMRNLMVSQK